MMSAMRISTLFKKAPAAPAIPDVVSCSGTLVLHADGTVECDDAHRCGADELLHELWVACDELGCGCVGDELPLAA